MKSAIIYFNVIQRLFKQLYLRGEFAKRINFLHIFLEVTNKIPIFAAKYVLL